MSAMIGKGKSWLWWLAGFVCAVVFGAKATAAEAVALYGIRPGPAEEAPPVNPDQQKKAEQLVNELVTPIPAPEPPPAAKAEIEKCVKDFASNDPAVREAASTAVVKQGTAALGLLRAGTESKDAEVAERSKMAIAAIEKAAREPKINELKGLGGAGQMLLRQKLMDANKAAKVAEDAAAAAEKDGKAVEAEKAKAEAKLQRERAATISAILRQLMPPMPAVRYGVIRQLDVN